MIIAFLGESINSYRKNLWVFLTVLTLSCPTCQGSTHWHAWYDRSVKGELEPLPVLRVRCCSCRKTHAVIPDFLSPYKQYSQTVQQAVLVEALEENVPLEQIDIGEPEEHKELPSIETIRRWVRVYRQKQRQYRGALVSFLARQGHYIEQWQEGFAFYEHLISAFEHVFQHPLRGSCLLGQVNIALTISQLRLWV